MLTLSLFLLFSFTPIKANKATFQPPTPAKYISLEILPEHELVHGPVYKKRYLIHNLCCNISEWYLPLCGCRFNLDKINKWIASVRFLQNKYGNNLKQGIYRYLNINEEE